MQMYVMQREQRKKYFLAPGILPFLVMTKKLRGEGAYEGTTEYSVEEFVAQLKEQGDPFLSRRIFGLYLGDKAFISHLAKLSIDKSRNSFAIPNTTTAIKKGDKAKGKGGKGKVTDWQVIDEFPSNENDTNAFTGSDAVEIDDYSFERMRITVSERFEHVDLQLQRTTTAAVFLGHEMDKMPKLIKQLKIVNWAPGHTVDGRRRWAREILEDLCIPR